MTKVAVVCGSKRNTSVTRIALRHVADGIESEGGEVLWVDLGDVDLPVFDPDEKSPEIIDEISSKLEQADSIVLGTPMYHGSYSGALKNLLDYCGSDEFDEKTVGLVAVSGGPFPTNALSHLRDALRSVNSWVLPKQLAVPHSKSATEEGELKDKEYIERAEDIGQRAVMYAHRASDPCTLESKHNKGA